MSEARDADDASTRTDEQAARRGIAPWQRVMLVVAVLAGLAGLGLRFFGSSGGEGSGAQSQATGTAGPLTTGFAPQGAPSDAPPQAEGAEPSGAAQWSPLLVKGGFGFFAGFCIGYALRAFFKITLIVIGVVLLALIGLQQLGTVNIDWQQMSGLYDTAVAKLSDQFASLRTALTGSLPAAGAGGLGLFVGLKGRR